MVAAQYLHSSDAKIHENRLRRWDFRSPESCFHGLRGSAPTCPEQLLIFYIRKANADINKEFSEDTYFFEEQEMGGDMETGEQEENSTVYTPTEVK